MKKLIVITILLSTLFIHPILFVSGQAENAWIRLLDADNQPQISIVDGNSVSLRIELPSPASADMEVAFTSPGVDAPLSICTIPLGQTACQGETFAALGWYWDADGNATPNREIFASVNGTQMAGSLTVSILPRPVVMVHGFNSNFHAWDTYLGPQGYLAELGLPGFAVGDGQVAGVMDTGSLDDPFARTNSIAENAVILGEYIRNLQKATGAEKVDLLVHSMGGMISRYYLDRVMTEDNVAQLIILGTPMAGSSCAVLPASLGMLLPATIEIQPTYMVNVFNQQVVRRQGVPFYALAGTKLLDAVQSPCTPVPSDIVVTVDSVKAIEMPVQEKALLHTEMTTSRQVFEEFVAPYLQTSPNRFESPADPPVGSNAPTSTQFSQVFSGYLAPGETRDVVIPIDANVTVANFALYDTSRSLEIIVTGASGNQIELDPVKNGLLRVDDPSTLVTLGYGFNQPRPGQWVVTLKTTPATPAEGAHFALAAQFNGGARLEVSQDKIVPTQGETVTLRATLTGVDGPVPIQTANVFFRKPDGKTETNSMQIVEDEAYLEFSPDQAGIYSMEVKITGQAADGFTVDRAAFLTLEAQPSGMQIAQTQALLAAGLVLFLLALLAIGFWRKCLRKNSW
jgi:pimeloyl-ACP methyl ester carboxylesterase